MHRKPVSILVVEENEYDAQLAAAGLEDAAAGVSVTVLPDGAAALNYLGGGTTRRTHPLPHVVLLGVNAPGGPGLTTLAALKANHELEEIPVIVLTASPEERDIDLGYELGAVAILAKPTGLRAYREVLRAIGGFWVDQVMPRATHRPITAPDRPSPVPGAALRALVGAG